MSEIHVEAVIFDFGGVLTQPAAIRAELAGYERLLGLPAGAIVDAISQGELWEAVSVGAISEAEAWQRMVGPYIARLPPAFDRFRHGTLPFEPLVPEVVAIAGALRGQVRLGLLSNATLSLRPALERMNALRDLFDDIVISAEVGLRKPDRRIFELATRRLGVAPAGALLVDDKPRNTLAAQAFGMQAIVYQSPAALRADLARYYLTT